MPPLQALTFKKNISRDTQISCIPYRIFFPSLIFSNNTVCRLFDSGNASQYKFNTRHRGAIPQSPVSLCVRNPFSARSPSRPIVQKALYPFALRWCQSAYSQIPRQISHNRLAAPAQITAICFQGSHPLRILPKLVAV